MDEQLENLAILLGEDEGSSTTMANLPTTDAVVAAFFGIAKYKKETSVHVNQVCVVVWIDKSGEYEWFLGYITEEKEEGYMVDHLHCTDPTSHTTWAYPSREDIHVADADQILSCDVVGEWDLKDTRNTRFILKNVKDIMATFQKHYV